MKYSFNHTVSNPFSFERILEDNKGKDVIIVETPTEIGVIISSRFIEKFKNTNMKLFNKFWWEIRDETKKGLFLNALGDMWKKNTTSNGYVSVILRNDDWNIDKILNHLNGLEKDLKGWRIPVKVTIPDCLNAKTEVKKEIKKPTFKIFMGVEIDPDF